MSREQATPHSTWLIKWSTQEEVDLMFCLTRKQLEPMSRWEACPTEQTLMCMWKNCTHRPNSTDFLKCSTLWTNGLTRTHNLKLQNWAATTSTFNSKDSTEPLLPASHSSTRQKYKTIVLIPVTWARRAQPGWGHAGCLLFTRTNLNGSERNIFYFEPMAQDQEPILPPPAVYICTQLGFTSLTEWQGSRQKWSSEGRSHTPRAGWKWGNSLNGTVNQNSPSIEPHPRSPKSSQLEIHPQLQPKSPKMSEHWLWQVTAKWKEFSSNKPAKPKPQYYSNK